VVSTAKGIEGLEAESGRHFVQAEKPEETARAIVDLLADPARSADLGLRGRELVRSHYDWNVVTRTFGETLTKMNPRFRCRDGGGGAFVGDDAKKRL